MFTDKPTLLYLAYCVSALKLVHSGSLWCFRSSTLPASSFENYYSCVPLSISLIYNSRNISQANFLRKSAESGARYEALVVGLELGWKTEKNILLVRRDTYVYHVQLLRLSSPALCSFLFSNRAQTYLEPSFSPRSALCACDGNALLAFFDTREYLLSSLLRRVRLLLSGARLC